MKHKFFVGYAHQKIHAKFVHSVVGGEFVIHDCHHKEKNFPDKLLAEDGEDVLWFFNDLFLNLHPLLKGKQVYLKHGLGFNRFMTPEKTQCINRYIDYVFETGRTGERIHIEAGVDPKKIRRIGYTHLYEIPTLPLEQNSVLFCSTNFINWHQYRNLEEILKRLDPRIKGYVTIHPLTPPKKLNRFKEICLKNSRLKFIESQEDLLKAVAQCEAAVGQVSSVCTPFWYLKKPVIFLRGRVGTNPFKGFGWGRVKRQIHSPLFSRVLDESTKISHWKQFSLELVKHARFAPSALEMFYPSNYDRESTIEIIRRCVEEIHQSG